MSSYEITRPNYAGRSVAEQFVLTLFYSRWWRPYHWYLKFEKWLYQRWLRSLGWKERARLWKEANELARRLDGTRFQIVEIHRNQHSDIRAKLQSLVEPSVMLDVLATLWGKNTEAFDYEAIVGSQVTASYHRWDYGSSPGPEYLRQKPIVLNCLFLHCDREELKPLEEERRKANEELEKEIGPLPQVM